MAERMTDERLKEIERKLMAPIPKIHVEGTDIYPRLALELLVEVRLLRADVLKGQIERSDQYLDRLNAMVARIAEGQGTPPPAPGSEDGGPR